MPMDWGSQAAQPGSPPPPEVEGTLQNRLELLLECPNTPPVPRQDFSAPLGDLGSPPLPTPISGLTRQRTANALMYFSNAETQFLKPGSLSLRAQRRRLLSFRGKAGDSQHVISVDFNISTEKSMA